MELGVAGSLLPQRCGPEFGSRPNKYKTYVKQIVYVFYTSNKAASQIAKQC
jgi:hypothetical protein